MTKVRYVDAPRMEVAFIPLDDVKDVNSDTALFDICFILHRPGDSPPETMWAPDGPFGRMEAVVWLGKFWMSLGGTFENLTDVGVH